MGWERGGTSRPGAGGFGLDSLTGIGAPVVQVLRAVQRRAKPAAPPGPAPGSWQTRAMTVMEDSTRKALLRRGFALEYVTLGWNVAGIAVLAVAAISARSVALAGFGLDSLIER
jgi:hypothetical protein